MRADKVLAALVLFISYYIGAVKSYAQISLQTLAE